MKKKLMIILGSGGHTVQMIKLVDLLGANYEYIYVIARDDILSEKKIRIPGKIRKITAGINFSGKDSKFVTFIKHIGCALRSLSLVRAEKPDAIISCGPGMAFIISGVGKLFGRKIVFIESWSRIYKKSGTGNKIDRFTDLFLVQWPEMLNIYPKAIYAGRLG